MNQTISCPQCGSHYVQSFSVLHANGTRTTNVKSRSIGVGLTTGNVGIGVRNKTYQNQSLTGHMTAPPRGKRRVWNYPIAIAIGLLALLFNLDQKQYGLSVVMVIMVGWAALMFLRGQRYNKSLPDLYRTWKNSFRCNTCGTSFQFEANSQSVH